MKKIIKYFSDYYLIFCVYALIGWVYEVLWMWFIVPPKHFTNRGVLLGPFLPIYGFGMLILLVLLKKFTSKKHEFQKINYLIISTITVTTFIYTTIIEYTTNPKILHIGDYLQRFGIGLVISNLIMIAIAIYSTKYLREKIEGVDLTIILVFLGIWMITTTIEYVSHFIIDKAFHMLLWDYTKDFLNINARVNWDASRNFAIGGTFLLYTIQPLLDKYLPKIRDKQKTILIAIIGIPMLLDFILHVILKII